MKPGPGFGTAVISSPSAATFSSEAGALRLRGRLAHEGVSGPGPVRRDRIPSLSARIAGELELQRHLHPSLESMKPEPGFGTGVIPSPHAAP